VHLVGLIKENKFYFKSYDTKLTITDTFWNITHFEVTRSEDYEWNKRTRCLSAAASDQWPVNDCHPYYRPKTQVECKYCALKIGGSQHDQLSFNPLSPELNPICYLQELLAHDFLHVSRIRVKSLALKWLMSYIYGEPTLDVSRSHTTTQHSR
jgi:hypothetical protein